MQQGRNRHRFGLSQTSRDRHEIVKCRMASVIGGEYVVKGDHRLIFRTSKVKIVPCVEVLLLGQPRLPVNTSGRLRKKVFVTWKDATKNKNNTVRASTHIADRERQHNNRSRYQERCGDSISLRRPWECRGATEGSESDGRVAPNHVP